MKSYQAVLKRQTLNSIDMSYLFLNITILLNINMLLIEKMKINYTVVLCYIIINVWRYIFILIVNGRQMLL